MDYLVAYIAWDMNLRDLKKLSLNGITYSSLDDEKKKHLKEEVFPRKWNQFIEYVIEKFPE
jgi:adenosine deaminase